MMSFKIFNSRKYPKYEKEKEIYDEIYNIENGEHDYKKYVVKLLYSGKIRINANTSGINLKYDDNNFVTVAKDNFSNIKNLCGTIPCELDYFVTEINNDYIVLSDVLDKYKYNESTGIKNLCAFLDKLYEILFYLNQKIGFVHLDLFHRIY